ncbi:MAG: NAD(+)/NADH kinase, partial [Thermomicrobiales bacterium]
MSREPLVGIVANPASGKDIRRLVAHGSTFDNNEKINIVRRVLLGLDAAGVRQVAFLPDAYGIVERAAAAAKLNLTLTPLTMPVVGHASDSTEAAQRLRDQGASVIITLGGDGTNRAVAKGCGDVPLVPISTGTNNVFPVMVEGTLAGLAAGLAATGIARNRPGHPRVVRRAPKLDIHIDGESTDLALIDVVVSTQAWIGARALWEPTHLREVVLSRISAAAIGIASLGGALFPRECGGCSGAWIAFGDAPNASTSVAIPIAPGLLRQIPIREAT